MCVKGEPQMVFMCEVDPIKHHVSKKFNILIIESDFWDLDFFWDILIFFSEF